MILADCMLAARIAARFAEIIGAPSRRELRDDKPRSLRRRHRWLG
jgi:hypothetical protein